MNVQRAFLVDSFSLALDSVDKAVDATVGKGRDRIFLSTLGPGQNQLAVEVDDLVIQPLVRPQTSDVPVCDLLPAGLGYHTTFCEDRIDGRLVLRWETGG